MMLVLEQFLDPVEVAEFRQQLEGASWRDGVATAGGLNAHAKQNAQTDPGCGIASTLANRLLKKMGHHPTFVSACLPHQIFPPVFNRYQVGNAYDSHVDAAIMQMPFGGQVLRSDVSMTLFLSPVDDYEGGELEIEGAFGAQEVRLDAGDAVIYPSSSLHRVKPVTRGERLAAITWIQSLVRDADARSMLFDLDQSIQALTNAKQTDQAELLRLSSVYHNLIRRMADV
jgi:PKHD-type hydroxylase